MPPKRDRRSKKASVSASASASNDIATSSSEPRGMGLTIQIPNGNGNAIINPATGVAFHANNRNSSAISEQVSNVSRLGKEEANHNANHNNVSSSSTAANRNANLNANLNDAPAVAPPVSGPLQTDTEIDATIIHPHHLELKNDWSSIFKNNGLVSICDVCGRRGMNSTYHCNGINCMYDECETCHNDSHLRLRQQLPNSILPVLKIASNQEIINKMAFKPHLHDGMFSNLDFKEWKPNEIRRCDICRRVTLKSFHCSEHDYDECVYCRTVFNNTSTFRIQKERLKRQIDAKHLRNQEQLLLQQQQIRQQLGHGRHSKRSTHRKKAYRRTHKRSARK